MENMNNAPERMREIEVFGIPALFTRDRIAPEDVYPGMFRYEVEGGDDPAADSFLGTVLTPVPIPMANGSRDVEPGDVVLDTEAGYYTPAEFEEKYLFPDYDQHGERYGKSD